MGMITVGISDACVSADPSDVLVTHALGSCIAVAIHDPLAGVAGLLHILLPDSKAAPHKAATHPCMFADTGIPAMFRSAYALGAQKSRLTVRVVGGAQMLDGQGMFNVGKNNYLALPQNFVGRRCTDRGRGSRGRYPPQRPADGRRGAIGVEHRGRPTPGTRCEDPWSARRGSAGGCGNREACTQIGVCSEYLKLAAGLEAAGLLPDPQVPLAARARASWCSSCVLRKGGR